MWAGILTIGFPALLGVVASFISNFGRSVLPSFFVVISEGLLPVLLVAAVVQWSFLARRQLELDPSDLMERTIAENAVTYGGVFIVGEGVALYAVAVKATSTFLVVTPLAAGLFLLVDLMLSIRFQLTSSVENYLPSTITRRFAELERQARVQKAEQLEERARGLRRSVEFDSSTTGPEQRS